MNDPLALVAAVIVGLGAGLIFYGGLWLTVSRIHTARQPALLFAASFVVRVALALGALWWVSQGSAIRVIAWLVGFIIARPLIFRLTRAKPQR